MPWPFSGETEIPRHVPAPDRERTLLLYKYDSCPYCQRVLRGASSLGLSLPVRDTLIEPGAREELYEKTGRTQVPCLFIDGEPLFESADILVWLGAYAKR